MKPFTFLHPAAVAICVAATACSGRPAGAPPKADYDTQSGKLRKFEIDSNRDGKYDTVSFMDGTRVLRVELDRDENGRVERWDIYNTDGTLQKVGFASRNDGVMDSQAFYDAGGILARIEVSTRRDGRFDRTEYYERGVLVCSADDANGDGRPDKWDTWTRVTTRTNNEPEYAITSTSFDDSGSGRPERRFVYGPRGSIAAVEVDRLGDGHWAALEQTDAQQASDLTR